MFTNNKSKRKLKCECGKCKLCYQRKYVNYHLTSLVACDDDSKATVDYAKKIER